MISFIPPSFQNKLFLIFSITLLLSLPAQAIWPFPDSSEKANPPKKQAPPAITESMTPLSSAPEGGKQQLGTSFSGVVDLAGKSVVNIQTLSTGKKKSPVKKHPSLDDEFMKRFFNKPNSPLDKPEGRRIHSLGSGIIVSPEGYILTNNHVIDGADEIKITLKDDKTEYKAKLIGTDPKTDIALLKIDAKDLPSIEFGNSDLLRVGDIVLAIGNPFGLGQTVTMGIISATGRSGIGVSDLENFIQTDASINQGNSGGALVNTSGELIGINNAIFSQSGGNIGIGFAVPVNMAKNIMELLIKDGKVTRGYLGVVIQPVTPKIAEFFKLPDSTGALVGDVTSGSGAEAAGIKRGDVIIELDGRKIKDSKELQLLVSQNAPGKKVSIKAIRDGKPRIFSVSLKILPDKKTDGSGINPAEIPKKNLFEGVEIGNIDAPLRTQFNLPGNLSGAFVTNVDPESAAAEAGLHPGDIIQEINRVKISDATSAYQAKQNVKDKSSVVVLWNDGTTRYIVIEE